MRTVPAVTTIFICVAVPALVRWVYTRSAAKEAILEKDSVVFPESRAVPIIRWVGFVLFSAAATASGIYGRSPLPASFFAAFAILTFFFARGDPIIIDSEAISGASTWGRRAKLAWGDVVALEANRRQSTVMVIGKNGAKICHSGFHFDRIRFEEEVKRRTGLPMKAM
jgi:hypothetical protein